MSDYPKRDSHHAHKLTRLLFKSCAVLDIGHHAALLVIHIAHTEDAVRYQYPVRFWNGQLMHLFGWSSPKQLNEARRRAVEAGWLHYEREGNRSVGRYWTLIPPSVELFTDGPIEECMPADQEEIASQEQSNHSSEGTNSGTIPGMNSGTNEAKQRPIHSENGMNPGMIPGTNCGKHSNPIPIPNPLPQIAPPNPRRHPTEEEEDSVRSMVRTMRAQPYRLNDAETAIRAAMANGCTLAEVAAIGAHWTVTRKWSAAQLHFRLTRAMPGEPPDSNWPPPDERLSAAGRRPTMDEETRRANQDFLSRKANRNGHQNQLATA